MKKLLGFTFIILLIICIYYYKMDKNKAYVLDNVKDDKIYLHYSSLKDRILDSTISKHISKISYVDSNNNLRSFRVNKSKASDIEIVDDLTSYNMTNTNIMIEFKNDRLDDVIKIYRKKDVEIVDVMHN